MLRALVTVWLSRIDRALGIRHPRIIAVIVINIAVAAVLTYSFGETMRINISATPTGVVAVADQTRLTLERPSPKLDRVGLYLAGPRLSETAGWPTNASWYPFDFIPLLRWVLRPQAETALSSLTIEPAGSGELHDLFASGVLRATESDWFRTPANELTSSTPGIAYFEANGETDYQLTATLMRARQGAGILLLDSGGDGFGLWLQPWLKGLSWRPIVDGGLKPPVVSVPYRSFVKTSASQVQDLLRLLFGSYPAFIAIVGFSGLATGVAVWAARFLGARDIPRDGPCNRPDKTKWFAIGFVILALVANAYVAYFLLERLPHVQDSVAYLFQAKLFASGRLWAPLPDNVIFFRHEFVVEHAGKWFSKHPPGHSALLAIGQLLNAPWIVNPIAGAVSLGLIYLIGRRAYDGWTGLLAAALGALSPFFLFMSGSMMAHATTLAFVLAGTWFLLKGLEDDRLALMLASGVCVGIAFLIRPWTAIVIAVGLGIVFILKAPRLGLRRTAVLAAGAVIGSIPLVLIYLAYNWALTGHPLQTTQQLWWDFDRLGFGPDNGPYGHSPLDGLWNTSRNMVELLIHLYGWPAPFTLLFALVPFLTLRARSFDYALLSAWLMLIVGYSLWWADGIMYGPRFYFEGTGFLLILTARGVRELANLWPSIIGHFGVWRVLPHRAGPIVVYGFLGVMVLHNLALYLPQQWIIHHGYNYVNRGSVHTVQEHSLTNAIVFTEVGQWFEWWNYGEVFSSNSPLLEGDVIYARDLGESNRILMDEYPDRNFYSLADGVLTEIPRAD